MAEAFTVGKWKRNQSSVKGYREVMDALGIKKEVTDQYEKANWTIQYKVDGDKWSITSTVDMFPEPHTLEATLNVPYDTVFMDGTKAKGVIKFENGALIETMSDDMMKAGMSVTTTRTIEGKQLKEVMVAPDGTKMETMYDLVE